MTALELECVRSNLPVKSCDIIDTDCHTDLFAVSTFALIINPRNLKDDELTAIFDFYSEIDCFSESVIFTDTVLLPEKLKGKILLYQNFDQLASNLKYILLSAYRKQKKHDNFSATLANAITILSEIRKNRGITTRQLADKLEISNRTVQRYIETLRIAGEWIEYDYHLKGWKLSAGKSVLWGDFGEMN